MVYAFLKTLHVLAVIVWVGGMVFAHFFLRPAAAALEPPLRLRLMEGVLARFFAAVLVASLTTLVTGLAMIALALRVEGFRVPPDWTLMTVLGSVMLVIFGWIRFGLYPRLRAAVAAGAWPAGGAAMNAIRQWVTVNLALGVAVVLAALLF